MRGWWLGIAVIAGSGLGQTIPIVNPSFEEGEQQPTGWSLVGAGAWVNDPIGGKVIAVTGSGEDTGYWQSEPLGLEPNRVYWLTFKVRSLAPGAGLAITGPFFCNRDISGVTENWTTYSMAFVTPAAIEPGADRIRFGQWHHRGTLAYDDIALCAAQPLHARHADLELGAGEVLAGLQYSFTAPLDSDSRNLSRPLAYQRCGFNSNRWVFGYGNQVVYRHHLAGRRQVKATVDIRIGWYSGGELWVEASDHDGDWRELGQLKGVTSQSFDIPADLLPADEVWVRLRAQAQDRLGPDSDPGSFQVHGYSYTATIDGAPLEAHGETRFLVVGREDPRVEVTVESLGEGLPGGDNVLVARLRGRGAAPLTLRPTVTLTRDGGGPVTHTAETSIELVGEQTIRVPYEVPGAGEYRIDVTLGEGIATQLSTALHVADLHRADYGWLLPGSGERVALWGCESGWKVSQLRPPPVATAEALTIRAARNEAEAAQIVLRPSAELRGLTAAAEDLRGPGGATLPATAVEVLRVRYVPVTRPTDRVGVAAPWPDPLPPFREPIDLAAGRNQPLWVRVTVPRDAPAGDYAGRVRLSADGWSAEVPVALHVYDFTLPDRMTCTTAFGFDHSLAFRYHGVTDPEQRRELLDRYLANYAAHHISPYNPAPLDPFVVRWPSIGDWSGGVRDREVRRDGAAALKVIDEQTNASASAAYGKPIPIGPQGLRLRFWYKTAVPGHEFIVTFNHFDAGGQWMSGRNNDMVVRGDGEWQFFDRTVTSFAAGARTVRLTLWPCLWRDDGATTGTVWYDDVSVTDVATGAELIEGGDFEPLSPDQLRPTIDWAAWDAAMQRAFEVYHFNSFRLPVQGLGGGTFHSRVEPSLLGYGEDTPEYQAALRAYLQAIEQHLAEKGWLDRAYVYWFDEPEPRDYEFVMNGFRKLKEYAPRIGRMLTEQVEPELIGGPNIWCPVTPNYDHERAEERRREDDRFWWYVCTGPKAPYCTLFIDHPATELRVWLWQTWQRKIEGILVWQTNYWHSHSAYPDPEHPQNPYEDPMGWVSGYGTPAGVKSPWGNGDGRFVYPPEAAADGRPAAPVLDGPVDSIRWEMLRDGLEDYEYFVILRDRLAAKGASLAADERARYEALLAVPDAVTADMTTFTLDPAPLDAHRDALARAIEALGG